MKEKTEAPIKMVDWIEKTLSNGEIARKKFLILMKRIEILRFEIMQKYNINNIIWKSNLNSYKYLASLISLDRIASHINVKMLYKTVIFTSDEKSGLNGYGDVILSCSQVPQMWMSYLLKHSTYVDIIQEVKVLEDKISKVLRYSEIKMIEDFHLCLLVKDYQKNLQKFIFTLSLLRSDKFNRVHSNNKYTITDMTSSPFIHHTGTIVLPAHIESKTLIMYLDNDFEQAKETTKTMYENDSILFRRLENVFVTDFKCRKVLLNVPLKSGLYTLKRLLEVLRSNRRIINFDCSDLVIDYYYGSTSSGDVIIPWNFDDIFLSF